MSEGLLSNNVTAILQDWQGYIWIGTQAGLQRYDGTRFKNYLADIRDTASLQTDWISAIFEDSKKRLWIGTDHGAPYLFNRTTGGFYNYNLYADIPDKVNGTWHFAEDRQGNIWLAGHEGYYKLDSSTNKFVKWNSKIGLETNLRTGNLAIDNNNNFWLSTTDGIAFYNTSEKKLYNRHYNPEHNPLFQVKEVIANILITNRYIWISTGFTCIIYRYDQFTRKLKSFTFERLPSKKLGATLQNEPVGIVCSLHNGQIVVPLLGRGLALYHPDNDSFSIINADNSKGYMYHSSANFGNLDCLIQDKDNNIIIGNESGVNIFNPEKQSFFNHPETGKENLFPKTTVNDLLELPNGNILIGYYNVNGGIVETDSAFNFRKHYLLKENGSENSTVNMLWNLFMDDKGIVWAPNQKRSILKLNPANGQLSEDKDTALAGCINTIRQDGNGDLWIGHWSKGLVKINAAKHTQQFYTSFLNPGTTTVKRVQCILPDPGKIWVGTFQNGLQVFDKQSEKFTEAFTANERNLNSISSNSVTEIIRYNKDTLILATEMGINIFDIKNNRFRVITVKEGLPNNLVLGMMLERGFNLWVVCDGGGFCKINLHNLSITTYERSDGIIDNAYSGKIVLLKNGTALIAASHSFISFNPVALVAAPPPADVSITSFNVVDKAMRIDSLVKAGDPVKLLYNENSIKIEFASIEYWTPENIRYYYRLQGEDDKWLVSDKNQVAVYNQLNTGSYIFEVKCANRDGVYCNTITRLLIIIEPPFWKTWWFILLVIATVILLILRFVKWREKGIKDMSGINERLSEAKLEALRSQMNPHFIFNSLNAIQECILTNKVDAAYHYLSQFSRLQRMALNNSSKEFISLKSELEMLKLYLSLESLRFSQSFTYSLEVDEDVETDEIMIPSMLLQPYVENAIWHGLRNKEEAKILIISCKEKGSELIITIDDNGIGRKRAAAIKAVKLVSPHEESKGTVMSSERINILSLKYQSRFSIKIIDKLNDHKEAMGTTVMITLPLEIKNIKN